MDSETAEFGELESTSGGGADVSSIYNLSVSILFLVRFRTGHPPTLHG